jgi:hypothetical protein
MEKTQLLSKSNLTILTDSTEDDDPGNFAQQIAKYIWSVWIYIQKQASS